MRILSFQSYQGSIFTGYLSHCHSTVWALSILSRFYFYYFLNKKSENHSWLSILSRFYFYCRNDMFLLRHHSPFNPIKVLFLRRRWHQIIQVKGFQSYQGSIFTEMIGSILHTRIAFNPIKVLFLHVIVFYLKCLIDNFQSYQGSIFTQKRTHHLFWTLKTFNPIKVLFLQGTDKLPVIYFRNLSILSRFYFYNDVEMWFLWTGTSFNPIKVLFLHGVQASKFDVMIAFNPIKVLFLLHNLIYRSRQRFFQSYQGSIFT